jgi:hypothetical protein
MKARQSLEGIYMKLRRTKLLRFPLQKKKTVSSFLLSVGLPAVA